LLVARQGWATTGPETVPHVDVVRYAGLWYEVARLPMPFQKKCAADVTATYTLRPNGTVDVLNECRKANGKMTRAHGTAKLATRDGSNSKLKVTFFWPFSGRYWVLDLDPEYRWAMVGTPDLKYLWVLSRTPKLDPEVLERLAGASAPDGVLDGADDLYEAGIAGDELMMPRKPTTHGFAF